MQYFVCTEKNMIRQFSPAWDQNSNGQEVKQENWWVWEIQKGSLWVQFNEHKILSVYGEYNGLPTPLPLEESADFVEAWLSIVL